MYKIKQPTKTSIKQQVTTEGEFIEEKMRRIMNNKEPIKDGAPLMYGEREKGVIPGSNIRTDRWEVAIDAMDKVAKAEVAKRKGDKKADIGEKAKEGMAKEQSGEVKPGGESKA